MYLESVNSSTAVAEYEVTTNGNDARSQFAVFDTWKDWQPTVLAHHGRACCEMAREWVGALDHSLLNGSPVSTGPRWIREKYNWGACSHPIHWCEAVEKKTLDCGALAALAYEAFLLRGVRVLRAQFVQRYSALATKQWSCSWSDGRPLAWTADDLIYHEGCAIVLRDNEIKLWDASAGWRIPVQSGRGYGSLLAIRVSCDGTDEVACGEHILKTKRWHELSTSDELT